MDNIDRDLREAERLGYGCHYGWYKADHPYTAEPEEEQSKKNGTGICRCCGAMFYKGGRAKLYCSDECREKYNQQKAMRAKEKFPLGPAICVVCKKAFARKRATNVCCSRSCAAVKRNGERREKKEKTQGTSSEGES